jgi:hypothetical protein
MKVSFFKGYVSRSLIALVLAFALLSGISAFADEPQKGAEQLSPDAQLLATIRHMEALLMRPCDKVETLMNDLITYGRGYQIIEQDRSGIYAEWTKAFIKYYSDFIILTDEQGAAVQGKFIKEFMDLKKIAEENGILAEAKRPSGGSVELVHRKDRDKYFYFVDPDSAEGKKKQELRYKLETDYEGLAERWGKARDEFYRQFEDKGRMKYYADTLEAKTKEGKEYARKYSDLRNELSSLALTGNFEHCLGKMQPMAYRTYAVGDPLFASLYADGEDKTPDSLPGMGYKIIAQKEYKPLTKPDIGGFPLALHLKLNGTQTLQYEKELLKIKIQAEEEETRVLGFGLGKYGQFCFQVTYKTTEALAAPVHLVEYVVSHPVDTFDKSVTFVKNVPQVIKDIGDTDVLALNKKAGDFLWGNTEKLIVAANEISKDLNPITWDRYDPKPGETLEQEIDRLNARLESTKKVKEGMEVASTLTSLVVQVLADKGIGKGLGVTDDIVRGMRTEVKAAEVLKKVESIEDQIKAAKGATALSQEVQQGAKTVKELAEEQLKLNKQLQEFITGPKERLPGKALPADELQQPLKFKDPAGNVVEIPVGKQLGEGATSKAFVSGADDGLVVRVTDLGDAKAQRAASLDEFGRKAVDDVESPFLRTAKREQVMDVVDERGIAQHVEYVEKVKPAETWLKEQGGQLTSGQKLSLEQATRDLNAKGYAWVDNHAGNYAFEKLPGEDRWQVVVLDTGGIYPMKGANAAEMATNARNLQTAIADTEAKVRELTTNPNIWDMSIRGRVYEVAGDPLAGVDLAKVNLTKVTDIGCNPSPALRPDMGDLYKKSADDMFKEVDDHVSKAISSDPAFKDLKTKYDEGKTKLDEAVKKLEPEVNQAEKAVAAGPKVADAPDKPSGIDPDLAAKLAFGTQVAANTINAENCALLRKAVLAGSKDQWLVDAMKDCIAQGF